MLRHRQGAGRRGQLRSKKTPRWAEPRILGFVRTIQQIRTPTCSEHCSSQTVPFWKVLPSRWILGLHDLALRTSTSYRACGRRERKRRCSPRLGRRKNAAARHLSNKHITYQHPPVQVFPGDQIGVCLFRFTTGSPPVGPVCIRPQPNRTEGPGRKWMAFPVRLRDGPRREARGGSGPLWRVGPEGSAEAKRRWSKPSAPVNKMRRMRKEGSERVEPGQAYVASPGAGHDSSCFRVPTLPAESQVSADGTELTHRATPPRAR